MMILLTGSIPCSGPARHAELFLDLATSLGIFTDHYTLRCWFLTTMVCGRCHRESDDHPLSSSGPIRCEYSTHREDCPGGFNSACDISVNEKKETESKNDFIEQKDPMKIIEQALQHLNLHSSAPQPVLDAQERTQDPLLRLGLSPGQFKALADSINLVQKGLNTT